MSWSIAIPLITFFVGLVIGAIIGGIAIAIQILGR